MKNKVIKVLSILVLSTTFLYGGMKYMHDHTPHGCPRIKARHGVAQCHHTDDPAELRKFEKENQGKNFGNNPCTCPIWCFINGSPDPLMDW